MNTKAFKKFFKKKYPYSPIAILGRKTVERILGADIVKLKKLEEKQNKETTNEKPKKQSNAKKKETTNEKPNEQSSAKKKKKKKEVKTPKQSS